jgi:hypothetical protein
MSRPSLTLVATFDFESALVAEAAPDAFLAAFVVMAVLAAMAGVPVVTDSVTAACSSCGRLGARASG